MEYERLEPFPARRGDVQAASICSAICNIIASAHGAKKRFKIADFLLMWGDAALEASATLHDVKDGKEEDKLQQSKRLRLIAQMHVALDQANQKKKKRRG